MNPQFHVRPMVAGDIPAVMALADGLPDAPHWTRSAYETAVDSTSRPERIVLLAESTIAENLSPGLAGFAIASIAGSEAELESIAVNPERQRRGVARALFAHLADCLTGRGVSDVFLEVRASNHAARGLYAALGFSQAGLRKAYYAHPIEDALVLRLSLS